MTQDPMHTTEACAPIGQEETRKPESLDGQRLQTLWFEAFNASPDMISILDNHHRIVAVNSAMANAMGCDAQNARGQHCYELMHGTDRPPMACPHKALQEDGSEHTSEIYEERLNKWLLVSVTPLTNDGGELVGSVHIARDITAQKHVEQALRESEERFHHLSEATLEGVLISEGLTIIAANTVLANIMGYRPADLTGKQITDFIAPHHHARFNAYLRSRPAAIPELDCIRKDGTVFPVQAHTKAVSYKNAMVYQTAIRDMSQQKAIEKERTRHERLHGVLEMAGAVCHEINQPMMALYGYLDIMAARIRHGQPLSDTLDQVHGQLDRIQTITQKLMHITQYKTKDYPGGETIIDIDEATSGKSDTKESDQ